MAEIASLLAFVQLADRVIHLAKYYIEAVHDCPSDIRVMYVEVSSLKAVLENLDFLLKNGLAIAPSVLEQLVNEAGPIEQCFQAVSRLERLLPSNIQTVQGKRRKVLTAAQHLAWPLKENSARKILDDISRYRALIAFALTCDSVSDIKDIGADVKFMKDALTHEERRRIWEWLEITNPSGNHNNAWELHEQHTGQWMLKSTEWQEWVKGTKNFLWIHGIPGAGKTILASFLIEQIRSMCTEALLRTNRQKISQNPKRRRISYAYYYCYFAHNQDETAPFLRWILSQLCRRAALVPAEMHSLFQYGMAPSIPQLLEALEYVVKEFETIFVVIDAVDESQFRSNLLKVLRDLTTDHRFDNIRLLATSREYYDIESSFSDISTPVSMRNPLLEDDIRRYVQSALASNVKFNTWPKSLLNDVENALATGAKGMFRWAVCQIDVLQRLGRQKDIKMAISNLPKTLDETYERIFQLIPEEDQQFVKLALIMICGNDDFRPFPLMENQLLEAVLFNLHSGDSDEEDDDYVGFYTSDTLRDRCGCLISLTNNNDKTFVALAHYTVREFLYSDRISRSSSATFALSDALVRITTHKTLNRIVLRAPYNSDIISSGPSKIDMPPQESLLFYAILGSIMIKMGRNYKISANILDKDVAELRDRVDSLLSRPVYLQLTTNMMVAEREAIDRYNKAATHTETRNP